MFAEMYSTDTTAVIYGSCTEIGFKPKNLFEAEVLIDIHIREKAELRRKVELLEKQINGVSDLTAEIKRLTDENNRLLTKIEELKAIKVIRYETKSVSAKARWERERAKRQQAQLDGLDF